MAKTIAPDVAAHLHRDVDVTTERLDRFAHEPRAVQLRVLAALREKAVEDNLELTLIAISLAIFLPLLTFVAAPKTTVLSFWALTLVSIAIAALVLVVLAPVAWAAVKEHRRREIATVWLGAYLDELERRRGQRGRAARRWRATH